MAPSFVRDFPRGCEPIAPLCGRCVERVVLVSVEATTATDDYTPLRQPAGGLVVLDDDVVAWVEAYVARAQELMSAIRAAGVHEPDRARPLIERAKEHKRAFESEARRVIGFVAGALHIHPVDQLASAMLAADYGEGVRDGQRAYLDLVERSLRQLVERVTAASVEP